MRASPGRRTAKFLYGLLEGPLWMPTRRSGKRSTQGSRPDPRIRCRGGEVHRAQLALSVRAERPSHRRFQHARRTSGLMIERDNGAGTADKACPQAPEPRIVFRLAKVKRVYKIELTDANVGKPVRKIAYIDLLKITDPDNKEEAARRRLAYVPVLHHRKRRPRRCHPHHRRQRQQFAVLVRPLTQQGRRQRIRPARSGRAS